MGFFNNKPCATADRTTQALNTLCALLSLRYLDGIATIYSVKIAGRELVFTFVLAGIPDYVHTLSVPVLDIQDNGHTLITGRMHCSTPFLEAALNRLARGKVPRHGTLAGLKTELVRIDVSFGFLQVVWLMSLPLRNCQKSLHLPLRETFSPATRHGFAFVPALLTARHFEALGRARFPRICKE